LWQRAFVTIVAICCIAPLPSQRAHAESKLDAVNTGTLLFGGTHGFIEAPRVHTDVYMQITGIIARVTVTQRFHNPNESWVEGLYAFPLPENAAVDRLRMLIGERLIEGEIREKNEAQDLYEQARANGQRASVVHQRRPNLFRTAVANIGPGETIEIRIGYLQIIDQDAGRYSVRFPLTLTPRYLPGLDPLDPALHSETPTAGATLAVSADDSSTLGDLHPSLSAASVSRQSVSIVIDLDAGAPISRLQSSYHEITTDQQGSQAKIRLSHGRVPPDRDFELAWTPAIYGEPAATIYREHTDAGEHVLLMFMPPLDQSPISLARDVIFIIDTSGSMGGESIEQARSALLNGLNTLTPADKFTVIQFNSTHQALFDQSVPATDANIRTARDYVRGLRSTGGTEMYPALLQALTMPANDEHLRQIVFITDGAVGNEDQLLQMIQSRLGSARLFTVGIGSAPNGYFMRKAAQTGRGTFTYIGNTAEVDARMSALLHKLTKPVLTNIQLHWPTDAQPKELLGSIADLYAGEPIVVTARLAGSARGVLGVSGQASSPWMRQLSLSDAEARTGVATLWARNHIADVMDLRSAGVSDAELRQRVLPIALQYGLVSNYTSLVAIDRAPARPESDALHTQRIANTTPHGLDLAPGYPSTATPATIQLILGVLLLLLAAAWHLINSRRGLVAR
jgi:Ca-activated chloride channel family protein